MNNTLEAIRKIEKIHDTTYGNKNLNYAITTDYENQ